MLKDIKKFAFISRHTATREQIILAAKMGITLHEVGDADAFTINPQDYLIYDGVIVVHPASALILHKAGMIVGIFENENRSVIGGKPEFFAKKLHLFGI